MSWIEKEVKKRAKQAQKSQQPSQIEASSEAAKVAELWSAFQAANDALPPELRLKAGVEASANALPGVPIFVAGLRALNGAGLGFTGDAIRYTWPERSLKASHNFWIRWKAGKGYVSIQRTKLSAGAPLTVDRSFNPSRVEHIIKCLVMGVQIKPRAVRKRRLWIF